MSKKLIYLVSFVLVLGVAGNASADLVAHWAFDEGSGTTAFDSSGNGNNGTLQGDLKWVTGKIGGALEFNGTDSIIDIPYSPNMTPSEGTTMSAWVFPTDTTRSCIVGQFQGYGMALLGGLQLKSVIWGADWVPSSQRVYFEAIINLRPSQQNLSMTIQDPGVRKRIEQIARDLLEDE